MPQYETNLNRISALAEKNRDNYVAFSHYIDIMWESEGRSDTELDALVDSIAATIRPHIDCTQCANCCRSIAVGLTFDDIPRLAATLNTTPQHVTTQYVDHKAGTDWGEWGVFRESPCFLLRGKRCSVYANRPQACRDYPAFIPDFRWLKNEILRGVGQCPIIFNVIECLKKHLEW